MREVWDRHHGDVVAGLVHHWDAGQHRAPHVLGDALLLAGDAPGARRHSRRSSSSACAASRSSPARRRSACGFQSARTIRLRRGDRRRRHPLHDRRHARHHARAPAPSVRRARADRLPGRRRVLRARRRVEPAGVVARGGISRATRTTAISIATSASTCPKSELHGEVGGDGARLMTGIKYYRITGKTVHKQPYQPGVARDSAWEHAGNFVFNRAMQMRASRREDAGAAHRRRAVRRRALRTLVVRGADVPRGGVSPPRDERRRRGHHAARLPRAPPGRDVATPSASSWGAGGYGEVWVGPEARVVVATRAPRDSLRGWLVKSYRSATGARGRALDQAFRELLLLQSSDWNFILQTGTSSGYADARIRKHTCIGCGTSGTSSRRGNRRRRRDVARRRVRARQLLREPRRRHVARRSRLSEHRTRS